MKLFNVNVIKIATVFVAMAWGGIALAATCECDNPKAWHKSCTYTNRYPIPDNVGAWRTNERWCGNKCGGSNGFCKVS